MMNNRPSWKLHLGISTHIKDKTLEEIAAVAGEAGVTYLEVVAERLWGLPDGGGESRWLEIKDLLGRYDLRPLVHSSYIEMNMASLNGRLREAALRQSLRCLELAAFLEAEYMVIHPGNLNRNYPPSFLPEARRRLLESLKSLTAQAESTPVTIALENGWNGENHSLIRNGDEHAELIERVGSRRLRAIFDIGHANTFDVNLSNYMERLQPHLAGIHLHDNGGKKDEHLPPGRGTIRRADLQRCFEVGVPVVIEVNSLESILTSMAYLKENIGAA